MNVAEFPELFLVFFSGNMDFGSGNMEIMLAIKDVLKFDRRSTMSCHNVDLPLVPACRVKIVNKHLDPFKKFSRLMINQQQS